MASAFKKKKTFLLAASLIARPNNVQYCTWLITEKYAQALFVFALLRISVGAASQ